jgi:hypothetical protein
MLRVPDAVTVYGEVEIDETTVLPESTPLTKIRSPTLAAEIATAGVNVAIEEVADAVVLCLGA